MVDTTCPTQADESLAKRVLRDFGYFGHFLHVHAGGRSGKQHILLTLLERGPIMQRELHGLTCISTAALSEVVAKLEAEGLVCRIRSDADRRQQSVELTDQGTKRAYEIKEEMQRFENAALACLDNTEQEALLEMLDRLAVHWDELEQRGGDKR